MGTDSIRDRLSNVLQLAQCVDCTLTSRPSIWTHHILPERAYKHTHAIIWLIAFWKGTAGSGIRLGQMWNSPDHWITNEFFKPFSSYLWACDSCFYMIEPSTRNLCCRPVSWRDERKVVKLGWTSTFVCSWVVGEYRNWFAFRSFRTWFLGWISCMSNNMDHISLQMVSINLIVVVVVVGAYEHSIQYRM